MAVFWLWKAFLDVGGPIRIGNELDGGGGGAGRFKFLGILNFLGSKRDQFGKSKFLQKLLLEK